MPKPDKDVLIQGMLTAHSERLSSPEGTRGLFTGDAEARLQRAIKFVQENPVTASQWGLDTAVNIAALSSAPERATEALRLSAAERPAPTCATCKHDTDYAECKANWRRPIVGVYWKEKNGCTLHEPAPPGHVAPEKDE